MLWNGVTRQRVLRGVHIVVEELKAMMPRYGMNMIGTQHGQNKDTDFTPKK